MHVLVLYSLSKKVVKKKMLSFSILVKLIYLRSVQIVGRGHKQRLVSMRNKSSAPSDITQGFTGPCLSAAKFGASKTSRWTDFWHFW